ncbi:MAG: GIY-YIG nuclease family protein [Alphaproteobacteria bacterium]|nr:GIY-YIG nuclease family protein [Alphaproteobacteria bacterium]
MLHCRGGFIYTGHTDDLERRTAEHISRAVPGYTREHLPVKLIWSQSFATRLEALEAERRIKGWSKSKKLALVRNDWSMISTLAKSRKNQRSPSTSSGQTENKVFQAGDRDD